MGVLKTGLLHIHLEGCALTVLIDSCKLIDIETDPIAYVFFFNISHNSVCFNQMHVYIEYL